MQCISFRPSPLVVASAEPIDVDAWLTPPGRRIRSLDGEPADISGHAGNTDLETNAPHSTCSSPPYLPLVLETNAPYTTRNSPQYLPRASIKAHETVPRPPGPRIDHKSCIHPVSAVVRVGKRLTCMCCGGSWARQYHTFRFGTKNLPVCAPCDASEQSRYHWPLPRCQTAVSWGCKAMPPCRIAYNKAQNRRARQRHRRSRRLERERAIQALEEWRSLVTDSD